MDNLATVHVPEKGKKKETGRHGSHGLVEEHLLVCSTGRTVDLGTTNALPKRPLGAALLGKKILLGNNLGKHRLVTDCYFVLHLLEFVTAGVLIWRLVLSLQEKMSEEKPSEMNAGKDEKEQTMEELEMAEEDTIETHIKESEMEGMEEPEGEELDGSKASMKQTSSEVFKGPRPKVTGMKGAIFRVRRTGIYIQFEHDKRKQMAILNPGLAYVNGSKLLLDVFRTDMEAQLLLPRGTQVTFDAVASARGVAAKHKVAPVANDKDSSGSGIYVSTAWEVTLMWVGQQPMANVSENFEKRINWVHSAIYTSSSDPPKMPEFKDDQPWFIKSLQLPTEAAGRGLPHPDNSEFVGDSGVVKALYRPTGGLVELDSSKKQVFFHRSRVFLNGVPLSPMGDLIDSLPVGTKVTVDCIDNTIDDKEGGQYFEDCQTSLVALLIYTGERPDVPEIIFEEAKNTTEKFVCIRITEFDEPGETGVEGGTAEVVLPGEYNHLVKKWLKTRLDTTDVESIKKVYFHRSRLFHLGMHLGKVDLRYLFSSNSPTLGTLFCRVKPAKLEGGKAGVTHEVTVGWKASHLATYLSMSSTFIFRPLPRESTLLFPSLQWVGQKRMINLKALAKENWDLRSYLDVVGGKAPTFDKLGEEKGKDFVFARVIDLMHIGNFKKMSTATNINPVISCGLILVETGKHAGLKAFFNRNDLSVFGFKLNKANLVGLLEENEPVWVRVELSDKKEHKYQIKVVEMYIGWPHQPDQTVESMLAADRHRFLLYLENKGLTIQKFLECLRKPNVDQVYIPFRKEEMKGTVVQLDRDANSKFGATGGFIKVDKGPQQGQLVFFLRHSVWMMSHNMSKGDLTHVFIEGQKVSFEAFPFPKDKLNKTTQCLAAGLDGDCTMKASIVWTTGYRPDGSKSVHRNPTLDSWLAKRGLKFEEVDKLAEGKMAAVPADLATRRKSNMLKGAQDKSSFEAEKKAAAALERSRAEKQEKPAVAAAETAKGKGPVSRHGHDAERLCDLALSVTGPSDLRLNTMIKNDSQAQMAFHMQKALEMAVNAYRKSRHEPWAQREKGFGSYDHGPPAMRQQQQQAWSPGIQQPQPQQMMMMMNQQAMAMGGGGDLTSPWGGVGSSGGGASVTPLRSWRPASGSTAEPFRSVGGGGGAGWIGQGKKRPFNGASPGGGGGPKNKRKFQGRTY